MPIYQRSNHAWSRTGYLDSRPSLCVVAPRLSPSKPRRYLEMTQIRHHPHELRKTQGSKASHQRSGPSPLSTFTSLRLLIDMCTTRFVTNPSMLAIARYFRCIGFQHVHLVTQHFLTPRLPDYLDTGTSPAFAKNAVLI
jgi:hypothetical protein